MLAEYEIIVFSDEWGRHPFSCQHIMSHFVDSNRLIWVTPVGMRNPNLSLYDMKRCVEKLKSWVGPGNNQVAEASGSPRQLKPMALPYNNFPVIRMLNNALVKSSVRKAAERSGRRIVLTTLPITAEYVDCFDADLIVYYIVDDFSEWPGINRNYICNLEKLLIEKADLLIASAQKLCEIKSRDKSPVLIRHGVDYDHFSTPSNNVDREDLFAHIKRPVIGFFGAVSPWLDFDLIAKAAKAVPDWSFVFLGPVDADISKLQQFSNVHFPGKVPYSELPHYAQQFDVGIIPFLVNELTISVNPLKLLEYFACGLPVVSTGLPEVCRFEGNVYIANSADEFIAHLKSAVQEGHDRKGSLQQIARDNSWLAVAEKFSAAIEKCLGHNETSNIHRN